MILNPISEEHNPEDAWYPVDGNRIENITDASDATSILGDINNGDEIIFIYEEVSEDTITKNINFHVRARSLVVSNIYLEITLYIGSVSYGTIQQLLAPVVGDYILNWSGSWLKDNMDEMTFLVALSGHISPIVEAQIYEHYLDVDNSPISSSRGRFTMDAYYPFITGEDTEIDLPPSTNPWLIS